MKKERKKDNDEEEEEDGSQRVDPVSPETIKSIAGQQYRSTEKMEKRTLIKTMAVLLTSIRGNRWVKNRPINARGASSATLAKNTVLSG